MKHGEKKDGAGGVTGRDLAKAVITARGKVMVSLPMIVEHVFVPAEKAALIDTFRNYGDNVVVGAAMEVRDGTLYIIPGNTPAERPAPVPTKPNRQTHRETVDA